MESPKTAAEWEQVIGGIDLSELSDWQQAFPQMEFWQLYALSCAILQRPRILDPVFSIEALKALRFMRGGEEIIHVLVKYTRPFSEDFASELPPLLDWAEGDKDRLYTVRAMIQFLTERVRVSESDAG